MFLEELVLKCPVADPESEDMLPRSWVLVFCQGGLAACCSEEAKEDAPGVCVWRPLLMPQVTLNFTFEVKLRDLRDPLNTLG